VRELLNFVEAAAHLTDSETIGLRDLPPSRASANVVPGVERALEVGFKEAVLLFERSVLQAAIARSGGRKGRAAESLGLDPGQMKHLVKKHGL
jgi:DNA-binding NtrC family response regulator